MTDHPASPCDLDAMGQAELVRTGQISPYELVEEAIARAERVNPELNAIIHERFDQARAEAAAMTELRGPFAGVPMVLKDLDGTAAGQPCHLGMRFLAERGYVAPADSELTARFRTAGLVMIGRTNTPGWGWSPPPSRRSTGRPEIRGTPLTAPAGPAEGQPPRWQRAWWRWVMPETEGGRSGFRRRSAAWWGSSPAGVG